MVQANAMTADDRPGVLIVAGHFAPENVSGTHRSIHFARALDEAGIPVSVVTIPTEGLEDVDPTLSAVFPHEDRIHRIPLAPTIVDRYLALKRRFRPTLPAPTAAAAPTRDTLHPAEAHRESPIRVFFRLWSRFPDVFEGWYRPAVRAGLDLAHRHRIAAVFASGPPWTGLMVAHLVARRLGVPLITDFRDPWTTTMGRGYYPPGVWNSIARRRERRIVNDSHAVLFNSAHVMAAAERSYPEASRRDGFRLIVNGTDAPRTAVNRPVPSDALAIRHFGSLYFGRDVTPLLDALGKLGPVEAAIRVEQIGSSDRPLPARAGPARVEQRGILPYAEALTLMAQPHVLLVVQPVAFNPQIPTKLFEYLASGNPILVLADETSAVWQLAREYPRCHRLDHEDLGHNLRVLEGLVASWRGGALEQQRSVEDTAKLTKSAVGMEFADIIAAVIGADHGGAESPRR